MESAFIPLKTIRYPWTPLLLVLNSFGAQILTTIAVPLVVLWKQPPKKPGLLGDVAKAVATYLLYHAIINLTTTMWAAWLRRHLMLYRIFSPRFMTGAAVLLVVDLIGIIVAIGGVRCNVVSISEVSDGNEGPFDIKDVYMYSEIPGPKPARMFRMYIVKIEKCLT